MQRGVSLGLSPFRSPNEALSPLPLLALPNIRVPLGRHPCAGAGSVSADEPPERLVVTTVSGSRYAVWVSASSGWWVRAQAVIAPSAPILADAWRPIAPLTPWPPLLGVGLQLAFRDDRAIAWPEQPEILIECTDEWRHTTALIQIECWSLEDAWPGEPPMDTIAEEVQ